MTNGLFFSVVDFNSRLSSGPSFLASPYIVSGVQ